MTDYPIKSPRKLIEVALPLDAINAAWASEYAASLVGAAAVGGGAGGYLCAVGQ
jgi:hypothetical protein